MADSFPTRSHETKMPRFPPSPRGHFQNYAGLRGQNGASQPYPAIKQIDKASTCSFDFTAVAIVANQRFNPVNRYSCIFVAFSNTSKSLSERKKPDLRMGDRAYKAQLSRAYSVKRPVDYICSGAETPTRVSTSASVTRTASQAARRARESSGSTGRPSLGSTWQAA